LLESKDTIKSALLQQVIDVLKVLMEEIKNFSEKAALNIISNTFHDTKGFINYNPVYNFNLVYKTIELYERLLKAEQNKNEWLKRLLIEKDFVA
jgi:hypothetical protein